MEPAHKANDRGSGHARERRQERRKRAAAFIFRIDGMITEVQEAAGRQRKQTVQPRLADVRIEHDLDPGACQRCEFGRRASHDRGYVRSQRRSHDDRQRQSFGQLVNRDSEEERRAEIARFLRGCECPAVQHAMKRSSREQRSRKAVQTRRAAVVIVCMRTARADVIDELIDDPQGGKPRGNPEYSPGHEDTVAISGRMKSPAMPMSTPPLNGTARREAPAYRPPKTPIRMPASAISVTMSGTRKEPGTNDLRARRPLNPM